MMALALAAAPAFADDGEVSFNGSVAGRGQATLPSPTALGSTRDLPILHGLTEVNLQARGKWFDRRLSLVSDVSVFAQRGGFFLDNDETVFDHDIAENHPRLVISELAVRAELFEHLDLTIGKQRIVWGTGIANNPTDVINPPRDPTDPNFQRTGVWQLKLDVPLENATLSAFFAPSVLHAEAGIPVAMLAWPTYAVPGAATRDNDLHYSAGSRVYVLVAETDVNLWLVWSNLDGTVAGGTFEDKVRAMASVSRLLGDTIEVHSELLLQAGTTRLYANADCVDDDDALLQCLGTQTPPAAQTLLEDTAIVPRLLLGVRWLPADESILTVEYLYAGDGYDNDELGAFFSLQARIRDRVRRLEPVPSLTSSTSDGLPARAAVDVIRKHTLFVSYSKPRIFDDFIVTGGAVVTPEDLSGLLSLNVTWTAREWLQISAFAFAPLPSMPRLFGKEQIGPFSAPVVADDSDNDIRGAFDASAFAARAIVEARVFF